MDQLTLGRNNNSEMQLEGTGLVTLLINYNSVPGTGGQAAAFTGKIFRRSDYLVIKVSGICLGIV